MSKWASVVHRGVARWPGTSTGRCRNEGIWRVARSSRWTRSSQAGTVSSQATPTTVERNSGSLSMYQVNASFWRMNDEVLIAPAIARCPGGV